MLSWHFPFDYVSREPELSYEPNIYCDYANIVAVGTSNASGNTFEVYFHNSKIWYWMTKPGFSLSILQPCIELMRFDQAGLRKLINLDSSRNITGINALYFYIISVHIRSFPPRPNDRYSDRLTFSNVFSWIKMMASRLKFQGNIFPGVQSPINQHWFR